MFIQKFKNSDRNDLIILQKIVIFNHIYLEFMVTILPVLLKTYFQPRALPYHIYTL